MQKIFLVTILLGSISCSSSAYADCQMNTMNFCFNIEKNRTDKSRSGLSATEFCAAQAIIECKNKTEATRTDNHGYNSATSAYLRSQGISPEEARAIEQACGDACN